MDFSEFLEFVESNTFYSVIAILIISVAVFFFTLFVFNLISKLVIKKSKTDVDDLIIKHLKTKRLSLIAPFLVIMASASRFPDEVKSIIVPVCTLIIIWLVALSLTSILNGINAAYESRYDYNGVSIKGYIDIGKLVIILIAIIFSISIIVEESPLTLLAGLGAIAAVLMLVFQNTILSLVASIQIMVNDLLKEGDTIEVPDFRASGKVEKISLHSIKVRNTNMTVSHIPTYKIMDTAFINWRGMDESESRQIKRSILLDQTSIALCDPDLFDRLKLEHPLALSDLTKERAVDKLTNSALLRHYITAYLRQREDLYQEGRALLVRLADPNNQGVPLEIIVFTRTTDWNEFESIQADIFEHLFAVIPSFNLRISQSITGYDLAVQTKSNQE